VVTDVAELGSHNGLCAAYRRHGQSSPFGGTDVSLRKIHFNQRISILKIFVCACEFSTWRVFGSLDEC
jgi:hypothetical protein